MVGRWHGLSEHKDKGGGEQQLQNYFQLQATTSNYVDERWMWSGRVFRTPGCSTKMAEDEKIELIRDISRLGLLEEVKLTTRIPAVMRYFNRSMQ